MQDRPSPTELLEAVAAFLREQVVPASSGALAFHARVAANALDIARRELLAEADTSQAAEERASLQALLGSTEPDLDALQRTLCRRIADGALDLATPGLADHLWRTTRAKLAVDQPGYGSYRRSLDPTSPGTPTP
ncbi:DUF6285 domain-containing protein [Variovorax boronicumulans]|uniref:DUF6285 domain-containing protein n=1 Tax=Variovorax boronicumulans TaxID=436515 RepID=UPI001C58EC89